MNKNLKVAILFSGQPRYIYSLSYQTIKEKLLDIYDCDIYCHCWFSDNIMITAPWSGLNYFKCNGKEIDLIKLLYNPIGFEYDTPLTLNEIYNFKAETSSNLTPYNLSSMYKSMKRVYEVFEKNKPINKEYDVYIRIRYDAILDIFPNLENLEKKYLYFANHHNNTKYLANNMIISTNKDSFKILMNIYDKMKEFDDELFYLNDEHYISHLVKKYKLPFKLLSLNIFYPKIPKQFDFKISI